MASLAGIAITIVVLTFSVESGARDLRPSDHGLEFQTLPPTELNYPPEMKSFFNGKNSWPTSDVALPRPANSSDSSPPSWWRTAGSGRGEDHAKTVLMVASLVCGITGVIILVASGLLYLFKNRKHKLNESSRDDDNNKLQLVVRNP
ncbi:hypothetical protein L6164_029615 [Bauhinia variegata]|uniref:Uncharacterized protein n=1 Tax=Bauhinia variegata TaxID=167791 RepID=A0ACB9LB49_BAUVA|nr:hypothetical protein L6164_029615 [Bauhinia variegata]